MRDPPRRPEKHLREKGGTTERETLKPILEVDVLVLDELGAAKVTDWGADAIARVINARYNDNRTTIVTTNFDNLPPAAATERDTFAPMRRETLGDRIGERMRSRLQEMCVVIEMKGNDFRQSDRGRATFGAQNSPTRSVLDLRGRTKGAAARSTSSGD